MSPLAPRTGGHNYKINNYYYTRLRISPHSHYSQYPHLTQKNSDFESSYFSILQHKPPVTFGLDTIISLRAFGGMSTVNVFQFESFSWDCKASHYQLKTDKNLNDMGLWLQLWTKRDKITCAYYILGPLIQAQINHRIDNLQGTSSHWKPQY